MKNLLNIEKMGFLTILLYIFVFFPYIEFIDLGTDTQPIAFIIALLIICIFIGLRKVLIPKTLIPIFGLVLISIIVGIFSGLSFGVLRSVFGYISLPIITLGTYTIFVKDNKIETRLIKVFILIWGIVAIIQMYFNQNFMKNIITRMSTTDLRGVTSMAPEPTYYGTMMIFFIIVVLLFFEKTKERNLYIIICLVQIIFFAKSSMSFLIIGVTILLFALSRLVKFLDYRHIIIGSLGLIIIFFVCYIILNVNSDLRIVVTAQKLIQNPILYFKTDVSSNIRLASIYYSFSGALENFFIPNGFDTFANYVAIKSVEATFFLYGAGGRIMSTYGAAIYELGIFGLILPIVLNQQLIKYFKSNKNKFKTIIFILINLIFFTAVPLATPFIGFLLGTLLYYNKKSKDSETIKKTDYRDTEIRKKF